MTHIYGVLPSKSGIYEIKNKMNGHRYIGSSINMMRRRQRHLDNLRRGIHHSRPLQHVFNKYGEDGLEFSVIELCDADDLEEREQHYIDEWCPEYNMTNNVSSPSRGMVRGEEFRKNVSEGTKSAWKNPEKRHNMLKNRTYIQCRGKKLSPNKVLEMRRLWKTGKYSTPQIAKIFGVNRFTSYNVVNKITWNWIPDESL